MKREEHLLVILAEECAEIQQAVTKALRFGLDDHWQNEPTNKVKISQELADLMGIYFMLLREDVIPLSEESLITAKQEKIEKFLLYSESKGKLKED